MKKFTTIILFILAGLSLYAQVPQKMSFQAVVRNASDDLLTDTTVGMQISILEGSASGTAVYVETHTPTSNTNGLVTLEVGAGTVVSGDFSTIDWGSDDFYIKSEIDPTGGTSYTIEGTSQLLSVPYALFAGNTSFDGNTLDQAYDEEMTTGPTTRTIDADDGKIAIVASGNEALELVADATNPALVVDGNGGGDAVDINDDGTGDALDIDNDGGGDAIDILNDGTGDAISIDNDSDGDAIFVDNLDGAGIAISVNNDSGVAALDILNDGGGPATAITNDGGGDGIILFQSGAGEAIDILHDGTSDVVLIDNDGAGKGIALDNTDNTAGEDAIGIVNDGGGDAILISNDGGGDAMAVDNAGAGAGLSIDNDGGGIGILVDNVNNTGGANGILLLNDGGGQGLSVNESGDGDAVEINNAGTERALDIDNGPLADEAIKVLHESGATAVDIDNAGVGMGLNVFNGNPAGGGEALKVTQVGLANALFVENAGPSKAATMVNIDPMNVDDVLFASTSGTGTVANLFSDDNNLNDSPTLTANHSGDGSAGVFTITDEVVGKINFEPTVKVVSNGVGAGIDVSIINSAGGGDSNTEPGVLSVHDGFGSAGFFRTTNLANDAAVVDILNNGTGHGLHIESEIDASFDPETALLVEQANFSLAATKGRVAHFDLQAAGTSSDAAVLISSAAIGGGHSALRVIPADPTKLAGVFEGDVEVASDLTIGGTMTAAVKAFKIDHPLDPENKFLMHNSIESNERVNIYSGNIITDTEGLATVQLPDYMNALNTDFRYQLTIMDQSFARAVIWETMNAEDNTFVIKTDAPEIQVSWQLTGVRQDKWSLENPLEVEIVKDPES